MCHLDGCRGFIFISIPVTPVLEQSSKTISIVVRPSSRSLEFSFLGLPPLLFPHIESVNPDPDRIAQHVLYLSGVAKTRISPQTDLPKFRYSLPDTDTHTQTETHNRTHPHTHTCTYAKIKQNPEPCHVINLNPP